MSEKMKHAAWSPSCVTGKQIVSEGTTIGQFNDPEITKRVIAFHNAMSGIENPEEFRKRFDRLVLTLELATQVLDQAAKYHDERNLGNTSEMLLQLLLETAKENRAAIKAARGE